MALGQEVTPSANNHSEISNNYKAQLGTGNFTFNVPLFRMETLNPDFVFQGQLYYNSHAASTAFTSEGIMSKGWSADFLPSIYRNINEENTLWDEQYYHIDTAPIYTDGSFTRPSREKNDLFEFDAFGLRGSFRLVYDGNQATVKLIDCNGYVEIIPNATIVANGTGKIINLVSFTLKNKDGYSYNFDQAEESGIFQQLSEDYSYLQDANWSGGKFNGYLLYKRAFLLSSVTDKYNRTLVNFTYKTYSKTLRYLTKNFTYNQKVIDKICLPQKGCLTFATSSSAINSIAVTTTANVPVQNITLSKGSISFYNGSNTLDKRYSFTYNISLTDPKKLNNYGNFLQVNDKCLDASVVYNNEIQNYEAGLLKTITLPYKGKITVDYETNTYTDALSGQIFTIMNALNYEYVQVLVDPSGSGGTKTYSFIHDALALNNDEAYYLKFNTQLYTSPFPDSDGTYPSFYPGLQIVKPLSLQGFAFTDQCTMGQKMAKDTGNNTRVVISQHQNLMDKISDIMVYKKRLKPEYQRVQFLYGPSVRVKKITTTDENNVVTSEVLYGYQDIGDAKKSSGKIADPLWSAYSRQNTSSYKPYPIFYRYVSVEEPGKGKTVYELNTDEHKNTRMGIADVAFLPKNVWKYNSDGMLVEELNSTFEYFKVSDDSYAQNKLKKVNTILKSYEGVTFKTNQTEMVYDETFFEAVSSKISDAAFNDIFEEKYYIEKLGNAFYRTKVEKFKNSSFLNQSTFEYQLYAGTQAFNLFKTSTAKSTLPLETEQEITRYDFGNVLEYREKNGTVVSQIWGYDNSKVVAELRNLSYGSIAAATITNIKTASASATYNEANLQNYLNALRTLHPNAFITTYTYKPLIGISSKTDANGRKETYEYDAFNRLFRVINHEGLITKEYNYNIKN